MAPRRKDALTGDLFAVPEAHVQAPAAYDFREHVAELVAEVLRQADGDRFDIGARVSRLTGKEVSKWMLDAYTSPAREEFNLPFWLVAAIEVACKSHALTNWLTTIRGGRLLVGRQALDAELGKLQRIHDETSRRIRELKRQMGAGE